MRLKELVDKVEKRGSGLVWVLLGILTAGFGLIYANFVQDDAYITYRYARNLADGLGFVYNPGEAVLGTTTPLYTLLLATLERATRLGVPQIGLLTSLAALWASAGLLFELLKGEGFGLGLGAAVLYISNPIVPLTVGMESIFLVCLLLLAIWLYLDGKYTLTAITVGLAILTRYEMVLLAGLLAASDYLERRRFPWWLWPAGPIVASWLVYATLTFGSPIPVSAVAKTAAPHVPFFTGAVIHWIYFAEEHISYNVFLFFILFGALALVYQRGLSPASRLLLAWSGLYAAAAAWVAGSFPWYYAPLVPGFALITAKGMGALVRFVRLLGEKLAGQAEALSGALRSIAFAVTLCLLAGIQLSYWGRDWQEHRGANNDHRYEAFRQAADWLGRNAGEGQTLATAEIGYLGYFTGMKVIDLYGLVTPGLHPWLPAGLDETLRHALELYAPDYVLVQEYARQNEIVTGNGDYALVAGFEDDRYRLYTRR